jgi:hypothetical protein
LFGASSRAGINIAQTFPVNDKTSSDTGGKMKELANSLAQLAAIIMLLITLAVSTAAVSQWASADNSATKREVAQAPTHFVADAR